MAARPAVALTLLLSGCVAQQAAPATEPADQGIGHVIDALDRLGTIRFPLERPGSVMPAELDRPLAWRWDGDLDQAVTVLAHRVGYRVSIQTPPGSRPAIVHIDRADSTAIALFRELAAACSGRAEIILEPRNHLVMVQHHA